MYEVLKPTNAVKTVEHLKTINNIWCYHPSVKNKPINSCICVCMCLWQTHCLVAPVAFGGGEVLCVCGWYRWAGVMGLEALPAPSDINHTLDSPAGHRGPWFIVGRKAGQPWWSFNKTSKKALTHPLPTSPGGTGRSGVPAIPHTAISHWSTMGKARRTACAVELQRGGKETCDESAVTPTLHLQWALKSNH